MDKTSQPAISEIMFLVEHDPDGGYTARALGASIFTEADDMVSLRENLSDAVRCHFPEQSLSVQSPG